MLLRNYLIMCSGLISFLFWLTYILISFSRKEEIVIIPQLALLLAPLVFSIGSSILFSKIIHIEFFIRYPFLSSLALVLNTFVVDCIIRNFTIQLYVSLALKLPISIMIPSVIIWSLISSYATVLTIGFFLIPALILTSFIIGLGFRGINL
jgi:hypothetical protein